MQVYARAKHFIWGSFLALSIKDGPEKCAKVCDISCVILKFIIKLGSVAGPVIQANGRLTFEDDLRSGGLLYFTTQ
jgi:hypothetical protein